MRQIVILLFILGSVRTAVAQTGKPAPVITRYYCFTGNIDKYPVTFHLYRINNEFTGSYYYNSTEEVIYLHGTLDKSNFLKLTHSDNEDNDLEELSGNFKDSSFSGTWTSNGKLLGFRVAQNKNDNGLAFDYIYTSGSKKIINDPNNRTELSFEAATIWPTASSTNAAVNLVRQVIYDEFGEKESTDPIGKVLIRQKNDIINARLKKDEDMYTTYELAKKVKVEYSNPKLLTLSAFTYIDGGGVHGNYGTEYICLDLVNNRKLTISDVMDTLACRELLSSLLAKKLRTVYKLKKEQPLTEILFDDFVKINNNFSLTSKGIQFNYNPYEIAAFAYGEISLYIPFKELAACLKPDFKQLIGN